MFKKLRNRLLLVNMIIISALLLGSFGVIYFITWRNVENSSNEQLRVTIDFDRHNRIDRNAPKPAGDENISADNTADGADSIGIEPPRDQPAPNGGAEAPEAPQPADGAAAQSDKRDNKDRRTDMTAHFVIYTDADGNITDVRSPFEMDDDSYTEDISNIISKDKGGGVVYYAGGYWKFMKNTNKDGYIIGFIDFTAERRILISLALILAAVWIAALAAAFLISLRNANSSIKPVEESYNRQKQFVADASHELRTPLTVINTNVDVLLSHKDSTIAEEEKWLGYIKSEAQRMSKLTNDLLCLTRLDHAKNGENNEITSSFSDACENVLLTMEAVIFEKNMSFDYDIEEDIVVNAADTQLKQLVMILLDNAVKYTPEKGSIKMSLKKSHGNAVLKVRNTGDGISEEDRKQIFERFYRADKSRARESGGYGLGLAIAKAICESGGGSIAVDSEVGKYTEFTAKIPFKNKNEKRENESKSEKNGEN